MPAPVIQFKRGAFANLPGLRAGEPGFTTDSYDLYVGLTSSTGTNKFFGSSRYWTRETTTVGSAVKVVEGSNNGSNFIALKSPDSLSQDYTYTLPSSYGTSGFVLQSDGAGGLTWVSAGVAAGSITGITIREEGSVVGTAGSVTSINFVGEGYTATASGIGATVTLNDATTSAKGIASFNSSFFSVAAGAVSIANNAIGLGTHTYGQYAKSIAGGNGLSATAANADDGTDYTIDVNVGAGITITSDAVAFKNVASLSSNTLMKWDSGNSQLTNSIITDNGTTATVTGNLTVTGTLTGAASTASRANTVDISDTDAVTARVLFGSNGNGQTIYSDDTFTYNSATDSLIVTNAQNSAIKALDGTNAITINNTTGNVGIASDLTVTGNLFVAGSTTQVNTTSLQIEDRLIELGKIQGTAPSDTTWDLGILFNYYTASSNKKASVYWEHGAQRFLFASDVTESVLGINLPDSGAVGLGTTTPQLASPTFAPIEVGALWVNDTAGSSAVVSYLPLNGLYTGSPADRYLHNVTVDGGTF